jgi:hypothetical protein
VSKPYKIYWGMPEPMDNPRIVPAWWIDLEIDLSWYQSPALNAEFFAEWFFYTRPEFDNPGGDCV